MLWAGLRGEWLGDLFRTCLGVVWGYVVIFSGDLYAILWMESDLM